jgi:hypothetical protein
VLRNGRKRDRTLKIQENSFKKEVAREGAGG